MTSESKGEDNQNLIFVGQDESNAYTTYHHNNCGKFWEEKSDDHLPNYCPGCGDDLEDGDFRA